LLPEGFAVKGAILSDQVKSLDWQARKAEFSCKLLPEKFNEVIKKLNTLIHEQLSNENKLLNLYLLIFVLTQQGWKPHSFVSNYQ